jgi:hypothetical protein
MMASLASFSSVQKVASEMAAVGSLSSTSVQLLMAGVSMQSDSAADMTDMYLLVFILLNL